MGVNQSSHQANTDSQQTHGITVVNLPPGQEAKEGEIDLPARVLPILSVDGHTIDPLRHKQEAQLDYHMWVHFVTELDKFSNSRADLIATRESQLQEKIIQVDDHVQRFTDSYINDKHKALAKMNDDCKKIDEINKLIQKYTLQSELCVDMLNKLNFLLPTDRKLENLSKD